MTPEESRKQYMGHMGQHTAFDKEFEELACKYQVQAVCFYGGFGRPVCIGSVASRKALMVLLRHAPSLAQRMMDGATTVLANSPYFWVRERKEKQDA